MRLFGVMDVKSYGCFNLQGHGPSNPPDLNYHNYIYNYDFSFQVIHKNRVESLEENRK